jgi:hypothetical protein
MDYMTRPLRAEAPAIGQQVHKLEKHEAAHKLQAAISGSQEPLITATTVFPFTLFPDTITIDREKMTVAHREFFGVAELISIRIADILNVTADVGPFFGSLQISTRFFDHPAKPYVVNFLWRKDAQRIKRILQGYVIATQKKIDCSVFSARELRDLLDKLGNDLTEPKS